MARKLDEAVVNRIKELHAEGKSAREIAGILGVGKTTVADYVKEEQSGRRQEENESRKLITRLQSENARLKAELVAMVLSSCGLMVRRSSLSVSRG